MMAVKKPYLIGFALILILCSVMQNALATHISKPILIDPKTDYVAGDTIMLHGWVEYNEKPAPDVLLNFKLTRPDGTVAVDRSYPSNEKGQFEFLFDTKNEAVGTYQITITSHCLEMHRYACTYQNQTLLIELHNR
ncbi:MAG TPA: hypothetical protein PKY67_09005 [Nitrosomonas sp.]|jgi:hypothetical protein|nr:hypothetical protein [Nitrosomonas sp.]MBP6355137.1 hypothetical protein [Nitrosomonas sp.]HQV89436.1 hypothetical protein [Nitrosomonas sp.]HRB97831.1 hypothetical protein [Nitrosomonas sp.]